MHIRIAFTICALAGCFASTDDSSNADGKADGFGTTDEFVPTADWSGRLILPTPDQRGARDGVWFEVQNAPDGHRSLVGSRVWLTWTDTPRNAERLQRTTIDVHFDDVARASAQMGNILPNRLDGWSGVGPLESLAGARASDDMIVSLDSPTITGTTLAIDNEPTMIEGSEEALVRFLGPDPAGENWMRVQHYDTHARAFTGRIEKMWFPRATARAAGYAPQSSVTDIEHSPLNDAGWYVYGEHHADHQFYVAALEPRALLAAKADTVITDASSSHHYVARDNWDNTAERKGTAQTVALLPDADRDESALWPIGHRFLVIHLFGGVKGQPKENVGPIVTGHFAFGTATLVHDRLTGEPRFRVEYRQVYGQNGTGAGIMSGTTAWADYMGSLDHGWMYLRPVSDAIIALPAVTEPYDFGGKTFDPLDGLMFELQIMTERYRTGDGTGAATITPANSCVQDSNLSLYIALQRFADRIENDPLITSWLAAHPGDAQTARFHQLQDLAGWVNGFLSPLGIVRSDWRDAASATIAGVNGCDGRSAIGKLFCALTSYNTIFPRNAHDGFLDEAIDMNAGVWMVRTNEIGGRIDGFAPMAPTSPTRF